nr:uncharacterized protein LOC127328515 [Lolium perenne]
MHIVAVPEVYGARLPRPAVCWRRTLRISPLRLSGGGSPARQRRADAHPEDPPLCPLQDTTPRLCARLGPLHDSSPVQRTPSLHNSTQRQPTASVLDFTCESPPGSRPPHSDSAMVNFDAATDGSHEAGFPACVRGCLLMPCYTSINLLCYYVVIQHLI